MCHELTGGSWLLLKQMSALARIAAASTAEKETRRQLVQEGREALLQRVMRAQAVGRSAELDFDYSENGLMLTDEEVLTRTATARED
jgi:hypothetical protein